MDEAVATMFEAMKGATRNMVDAMQMADLCFGTVVSPSPLRINVEQKMEIGEEFITLGTLVQEFEVDMTVDHQTENATFKESHTHAGAHGQTDSGNLNGTHKHAYKGRKKFLVHLGLEAGERVIMIRAQGGQRYYVVDRVRG